VRDALNASAMIGFYRNDEAIVADRYEFVLNRFRRSAHQSFQRTRDTRAQHIDLVTNSSQFRTGAIVEFTIWKNLVCDARDEGIQLTWQILDQSPKHGSIFTLRENGGSRLHRLIAKLRSLQNRKWIQTRAFDAQPTNRLGRIRQSVEPPLDPARPQRHALGECCEFAFEFGNVFEWRKYLDAPLARFGLRVTFDQFQQVLVLESCEGLPVHEA
jgi:hypothetical protein